MLILRHDCANTLFAAACAELTRTGQHVRPRGLATTEILGAHLCLTQPRRRFVDVPPQRILNPAFAVAEALWVISGSNAPWIYRYNRALTQYTDGGVLQGAYGPRMRDWHGIDQLDRVRRLLLADPDSRQGVVQLYDPARDTRGYRDVPCTLSYRFYLRERRLHMHTTMRSQDLWHGFGYDIFTATLIQELMAGWLGVDLGDYHHHIDSLHVYDAHLDTARQVPVLPAPSPTMPPMGIEFGNTATVFADTLTNPTAPRLPPPWSSFAVILASYRAWTAGQRTEARGLVAGLDDGLVEAVRRWYDHLSHRATGKEVVS